MLSNSFLKTYLILSVGVTFVMMQAIACGSALYQVSLEGDTDHANMPDYSNDPDSQFYGIHSPSGWSNVPIPIHFGEELDDIQQQELQEAMNIWEIAVGKPLFQAIGIHTGVRGDHFSDLFSSLQDSFNGNYFFNDWQKTNKKPTVLATAVWNVAGNSNESIVSSDIHFNNENYFFARSLYDESPDRENRIMVDMRSLALHELGHFLGLSHVDPSVEQGSVMNPSLFIGPGLVTWALSRGDIARIQSIYGCFEDACDVESTFLAILNRP